MYIIWGGSSVQLLVPDQFLTTGKVSATMYYMYNPNKHIFEIFKKKNRLEDKQERKSPRKVPRGQNH